MRFCHIIMLVIMGFIFALVTPQVTWTQEEKCNKEDAKLVRDKPNSTVGYQGMTLYAGAIENRRQTDAIVAAFIEKQFRWCRYYDMSQNTNSEAHQLDEWDGRVFVTITADNKTSEYLNEFTQNGWIPSYGLGEGPQVAVVVEIDPISGGWVQNGTYIISKTEDGLTNSVIVHGVQYWDEKVFVTGVASSYLLDAEGTPYHYLDCPRGSSFRYTLDYHMTTLLNVECNGVILRADAVLRGTGEIPENLPEPINPGGAFFAYCTNSQGIQVVGITGDTGHELFVVPNHMIGNGLLQAVETGENVKLGEGGIVSLWALSTDELQLHTTEPYDFIFSKYRCGDPIPSGEAVTVATANNPQIFENNQPESLIPASASSLPVYRPSALRLNEDGTYTVRTGDSLNAIAAKLGVDVDELAELNGIDNKRFIVIGQILEIPES